MPTSEDPVVRIYRPEPAKPEARENAPQKVEEIGGRRDGTDPTRFGDWEKDGRCIDF